jgi:hypothetical protein
MSAKDQNRGDGKKLQASGEEVTSQWGQKQLDTEHEESMLL